MTRRDGPPTRPDIDDMSERRVADAPEQRLSSNASIWEEGTTGAARLALKFKVTPRDCDSSLPQRGNRRKRWGERKNKGSLLTFSSTHSHTKHVQQPEGPFINTYVEAGTATPRGRNAPHTRNMSQTQDPNPAIVVKSFVKTKKKRSLCVIQWKAICNLSLITCDRGLNSLNCCIKKKNMLTASKSSFHMWLFTWPQMFGPHSRLINPKLPLLQTGALPDLSGHN